MSLILNKSQAEAVYSAMCALNNVGGRINATLNETQRVVERISGSIFVMVWIDLGCVWVPRERYTDQAAFAAAYGLNSAEPQNAIAVRGVQWPCGNLSSACLNLCSATDTR